MTYLLISNYLIRYLLIAHYYYYYYYYCMQRWVAHASQVHIVISYTLNQQILCRAIHIRLSPVGISQSALMLNFAY